MPIFDVFSKRNRTKSMQPLVHCELPVTFRVQVIHIFNRVLGAADGRFTHLEVDPWRWLHDTIAEEHGVLGLGRGDTLREATLAYFGGLIDVDRALDVVELGFRLAEKIMPQYRHIWELYGISQAADDAVEDLNGRFAEHNLGYRYSKGQIIRLDSEYLHAEVAEPALVLLHASGFTGAEEEFRKAHAHLRHGRTKEAAVDALKAFESTMKTICERRGWAYDKKSATAKGLIAVVLKEGLIPTYLESELASLRTLLESCLPTVRNRTSGHGQGAEPKPVPPYLAQFALHTAASNIVLLMAADAEVRPKKGKK